MLASLRALAPDGEEPSAELLRLLQQARHDVESIQENIDFVRECERLGRAGEAADQPERG